MKRLSRSLEIVVLVAVIVAVGVVAYLYYECGPEKCYGFARRILFIGR
ncbi:MAG TPA: hypothetical protein VFG28_13250 [Syntrophales bacterium]|nr:hypothetical protein [Syntrophales bacterium]